MRLPPKLIIRPVLIRLISRKSTVASRSLACVPPPQGAKCSVHPGNAPPEVVRNSRKIASSSASRFACHAASSSFVITRRARGARARVTSLAPIGLAAATTCRAVCRCIVCRPIYPDGPSSGPPFSDLGESDGVGQLVEGWRAVWAQRPLVGGRAFVSRPSDGNHGVFRSSGKRESAMPVPCATPPRGPSPCGMAGRWPAAVPLRSGWAGR